MGATEESDERSTLPTSNGSPPPRLRQMESSFEEINVRIAHLAIALGISLKDENEMASAMRQNVGSVPREERRSTPERRASSRTGCSAERRVENTWQELRGLLALRNEVLLHYVEQVGVVNTRRILTEVEKNMTRKGFKCGDDGINIDHLFNTP